MDKNTQLEEQDDYKIYRRVKMTQLALEGFQLGSLFVFFNGIQDNLNNGSRGWALFSRYGFKKNQIVPFVTSGIFVGIDVLAEFFKRD